MPGVKILLKGWNSCSACIALAERSRTDQALVRKRYWWEDRNVSSFNWQGSPQRQQTVYSTPLLWEMSKVRRTQKLLEFSHKKTRRIKNLSTWSWTACTRRFSTHALHLACRHHENLQRLSFEVEVNTASTYSDKRQELRFNHSILRLAIRYFRPVSLVPWLTFIDLYTGWYTAVI